MFPTWQHTDLARATVTAAAAMAVAVAAVAVVRTRAMAVVEVGMSWAIASGLVPVVALEPEPLRVAAS